MSDGPERAAERAFFLNEFRHRTLLVAIGSAQGEPGDLVVGLHATIEELLENGSRVVVISSGPGPLGPELLAASLHAKVFRGLRPTDPDGIDELATLWIALSESGVTVVDAGTDVTAEVGALAAQVATRLRADKLVLTDVAGGWGDPTRSFVDFGDDAERFTDDRPEVAEAVFLALEGGVSSVNLCRLDELDQELFTFDGAGTLFTRDAYVRVSELSLDDLPVVEELVARGVEEGFLRPRPRVEVVRVALSGLGARVARSGHLAAIGSLETLPYAAERIGEVTCLYTVNRFSGEGAAGQLLEGLVASAFDRGLRALFACTVSERAAAFFERHGFRNEDHDRVPSVKWTTYDPERRSQIRVLWLDLGDIT